MTKKPHDDDLILDYITTAELFIDAVPKRVADLKKRYVPGFKASSQCLSSLDNFLDSARSRRSDKEFSLQVSEMLLVVTAGYGEVARKALKGAWVAYQTERETVIPTIGMKSSSGFQLLLPFRQVRRRFYGDGGSLVDEFQELKGKLGMA